MGQKEMNEFLQKLTAALSTFLNEHLPTISDDWWGEKVLNVLTYRQRQIITQRSLDSLSSLDLAALLRIFDQNWHSLSTKLSLNFESRHHLKEMVTIRNRWAHAGTEPFPIDDIYRDLDTLQRFAQVVNANEGFIEEVQQAKKELVQKESTLAPLSGSDFEESPSPQSDTDLQAGQIVCLKSNPETKGAIASVLPGHPENRYQVFINNRIQILYASQLQPDKLADEEFEHLSFDDFNAYLTALQIRFPGLSTLYSLNAARIDFVPYQFRPVLKFIRSDRPRLLIADSVGVGKTIEAGLILRELQARREIRSVLIVCPRPLVAENKWRNEMKRFEERFEHLDGPAVRFCIQEMDLEGDWPEKFKKAIIPYSLFDKVLLHGEKGKRNRKIGLLDLDPPPRFDLVIVDEAHHIRNTDTYSNKAVRFFCDHAEAAIFLTATPLQLGNQDLYVLLNTLRPDLIIDWQSYNHMAAPNPFINQAIETARSMEIGWEEQSVMAMDKAADTGWGQSILKKHPEFNRIRKRLIEGEVSPDERVRIVTEMETFHTFSGIISRTRRRDIGDFTVRKPETIEISFTPDQQDLHDSILAVQAEIFTHLHGDATVKFIMTTIRRQCASCLFGLLPLLEEILSRHVGELTWTESDSAQPTPDEESINLIAAKIIRIFQKVQTLPRIDPKLEALRKIIQDKQNLAKNKLIVFSSFRHTLGYLYQNLQADGFRVGMVHGDTPDDDRAALREYFATERDHPEALDILLFSEIGCEGLDYQFCDCIVNYDLPWNPMRIEQRIGRIDRKGQQSDVVAIYNLITPGTVDADIYERCMRRIGVFNHALGGSEEILGEITTEIRNIAENLSLTEQERNEKLQHLADNKIRRMQEQEHLEEKQKEFFGIRLSQDQINQEIDSASSFWLSPYAISGLVNRYLQRRAGKRQEFILGEKPLKTLRLSEETRNLLLKDFQKLRRHSTSTYRQWENYLKGGEAFLPVTFDPECAAAYPNAAFIMPLHPLVKQAAFAIDRKEKAITVLRVEETELPPGRHLFAIYAWRYQGLREDLVLRPIALDEKVTAKLFDLLERAQEEINDYEEIPALNAWDRLEDRHYRMWTEAKEKHRIQTLELAQHKKESLDTSHKARIALLKEQYHQAADEKIKRMRQSQIHSAETDYSRRVQDLDIAAERADIISDPVAYGVMHIS